MKDSTGDGRMNLGLSWHVMETAELFLTSIGTLCLQAVYGDSSAVKLAWKKGEASSGGTCVERASG